MSNTITLGKSRKDGSWVILVQPEKPFGDHLDAYRKIANKAPVNDEFSVVLIGKLNHSSPALKLISTKEGEARVKMEQDRLESIKNIVANSGDRQKEMEEQISRDKQEEHEIAIAEKNKSINQIRKDTKQEVIKPTPPPGKNAKNKYLDDYKDKSQEELIQLLTSTSAELEEHPDNAQAKAVNEAANELLKKFNK